MNDNELNEGIIDTVKNIKPKEILNNASEKVNKIKEERKEKKSKKIEAKKAKAEAKKVISQQTEKPHEEFKYEKFDAVNNKNHGKKTKVKVASKNSSAMDKIKQFGKDHKRGLAIAGLAAAAGGAYYLHKKRKEKDNKYYDEEELDESFNIFIFDEAAYITESTMDMLLEACDYELSEEEILDNISEVINFYE